MEYLGAWGILIHAKNWDKKSRVGTDHTVGCPVPSSSKGVTCPLPARPGYMACCVERLQYVWKVFVYSLDPVRIFEEWV